MSGLIDYSKYAKLTEDERRSVVQAAFVLTEAQDALKARMSHDRGSMLDKRLNEAAFRIHAEAAAEFFRIVRGLL